MVEYAALKVRITLTADRRHQYPAFNSLPSVQASGLDWSRYVDANGLGWRYDNRHGHADDVTASPSGTWWGLLLVDGDFADEAVSAFPADCMLKDDASAGLFYSACVSCTLPHERIDTDALNGMKAELDLIDSANASSAIPSLVARRNLVLGRIQQALNPDDNAPGVRANPEKTWAGLKAKYGMTVRDLP